MFNKKKIYLIHAFFIWFLAVFIFFIEYLIRVSPSSMIKELMISFDANNLQISSFSAFFMYAYVIMQIPVGLIVDKYGSKMSIVLSASLYAICTYFFAFTYNIFIAQICRFFLGLTGAFAFIGTLKLCSNWFPRKTFSILVGLTQSVGMIGGALGSGIMGRLVKEHGWRQSLEIFAIILFINVFFVLLFVKNKPQYYDCNKNQLLKDKYGRFNVKKNLLKILRNKQTWLIAIISGLIYIPTGVLAELWGSFYLINVREFSSIESTDAISIIFIGWALGGPFFGKISDIIGRRKTISIGVINNIIILPIILFYPIQDKIIIYILLFIYGILNSSSIVCYTSISEQYSNKVQGTALGFANALAVLISAVFQQLIGFTIDFIRQKRVINNYNDYIPYEIELSMSVIMISVFFSLIIFFFIKNTDDE